MPGESTLEAVEVAASALGHLDNQGVGEGETAAAKGKVWADAITAMNTPLSNEQWIRRCVCSILYNAGLSTAKDQLAIFSNATVDDTAYATLLSKYISGVLDDKKKYEISCALASGCSLSADDILSAYQKAWVPAELSGSASEAEIAASAKKISKYYEFTVADTSSFPGPFYAGRPLKMKKGKTEVVSGGTQWTFPNGVNVVYKKAATDGVMYYSLLMNGGRSNVDGAKEGE